MGYQENFYCMECGFKFIDNHLNFFYDEESKKVEEFMIVRHNCDIDSGAKIKGSIRKTYCPDCDKTIKNYIITFYNKDLDKEIVIDKVKKGIKRDKKYSLVKIGNKEEVREYDNNVEYIICPYCNKKISAKFELYNCPKCDKPLNGDCMCID